MNKKTKKALLNREMCKLNNPITGISQGNVCKQMDVRLRRKCSFFPFPPPTLTNCA